MSKHNGRTRGGVVEGEKKGKKKMVVPRLGVI
jgi:hypothetical protein